MYKEVFGTTLILAIGEGRLTMMKVAFCVMFTSIILVVTVSANLENGVIEKIELNTEWRML